MVTQNQSLILGCAEFVKADGFTFCLMLNRGAEVGDTFAFQTCGNYQKSCNKPRSTFFTMNQTKLIWA